MHLSSVLGRTELCHEVWTPGPQKPQIISNENHYLALLENAMAWCTQVPRFPKRVFFVLAAHRARIARYCERLSQRARVLSEGEKPPKIRKKAPRNKVPGNFWPPNCKDRENRQNQGNIGPKTGESKALVFFWVRPFNMHAPYILSADDLDDFSGIL